MANGSETMAKQRSTFEMRRLVQVATRPSRSERLGLEATPAQHLPRWEEQQTLHGSRREGQFVEKCSLFKPRGHSVHALDNCVNTIVIGLVEYRCVPLQ
ncbi:hypothetical protein MTO96_026811 [Rhipicephalus appendiculatus]